MKKLSTLITIGCFIKYLGIVSLAHAQGGPGPLPGLPGGAPYDVQENAAGSFGAVPSRVPNAVMTTDGSGHPYWTLVLPNPVFVGTTPFISIPSVNTGGRSFYTCGYTTCGDGGQALYVPALVIPRMATGAVCATNTECVTDGVTNTTTVVTSATASFNTFDVGRPISDSDGDIPTNDTIASVTNPNTAVLAVAATGSHSNNTFTFGSLASNSPGYVLDASSNPISLAPQQINPLMFGALPYVSGSTPDSHAALQSFLDAEVLTNWPATGQGSFYSSTQLAVALTHINQFNFNAPDQSLVVNFPTNLTAPNFLISMPGGTANTGGGGGSPVHSTFHWRLTGMKFVGNVAGQVCQLGDPNNADAPNDTYVQVSCVNNNATHVSVGCAFESFYNSEHVYFDCIVARPHGAFARVTDGVIASGNQLSSATWTASSPLTTADIGNMVSVQSSAGVEECPAGTIITAVVAGVATVTPPSGSCTNGTAYKVAIAAGTPVTLTAMDTINFFGIASQGAVEMKWITVPQNAGYSGVRNNVFHVIDFDGDPIIGVQDIGGYNYNNSILSGNTNPLDYLACTVDPQVINGSNKFYNPFLNGAITVLGQTGGCLYTYEDWYIDVPSISLVNSTPTSTSWIPNPVVSGTTYLNATGQASMVYFKTVTQTSISLNSTVLYATTVTNGNFYVPSGSSVTVTCSVCGAWFAEPVY